MATHFSSCPLCQQNNHCARVLDQHSASCWCQTVVFSPSLINRANQKTTDKQCICQPCAELAAALASDPTSS